MHMQKVVKSALQSHDSWIEGDILSLFLKVRHVIFKMFILELCFKRPLSFCFISNHWDFAAWKMATCLSIEKPLVCLSGGDVISM